MRKQIYLIIDKHAFQILCGKCGNGLGHEFLGDGPKQGHNRY